MKRMLIAVMALAAAPLMAGTNYVDAVYGNDDWDGSRAYEDRDESVVPVKGPRRTLAKAAELLRSGQSDVLYVAEGRYDEGEMTQEKPVGTFRFRIRLPLTCSMIASGAKERTFIVGAAATADQAWNQADYAEYQCGSNAVSCIQTGGDGTIVKGFTITGARVSVGNDVNDGYGAGVRGGGFLVDCVVSNCWTSLRGGGLCGGTAIRCLFEGNKAKSGGAATYFSSAFNCVFGDSEGCTYTTTLNCSFKSRAYSGGTHYNDAIWNDPGYATPQLYATTANSAGGNPTLVTNCVISAAVRENIDNATMSPTSDASILVDAGDISYYESKYPSSALVAEYKYQDYFGNSRVAGRTIDRGAVEYHWPFPEASSGLTATLEGNVLTVARNFTSERLVTGFKFNGEPISFDASESWTTTLSIPMADCSVAPVYAETQTDWYVSPNADPTKGPVGDDANRGYHRLCPRRTLAGAMALVTPNMGHVVHAAPGVYDDGVMAPALDSTSNRVVVAEGVGLVADGDADDTVIEGFVPAVPGHGNETSVRCVRLKDGAYVKGFTLRNGSTAIAAGTGTRYGDAGGGVNGGTAIDCVISNCYAVRGGGAGSATLIRCHMQSCANVTGSNSSGGIASCSATGMYLGSLYDSYVSGELLDCTVLRNCVIAGRAKRNNGTFRVYNSYVATADNGSVLTNCIVNVYSGAAKCDKTLTGIAMNTCFDWAGRPLAGSRTIDSGNTDDYEYPAAMAHERGKDLSGGQRVYNGCIDIGCYEYDWRGPFGLQLDPKGRIVVVEAGPGVVTNAVGGLTLSKGDVLTVDWNARAGGKRKFSASGDVSVTVDGAPVAPASEGVWLFDMASESCRVSIRMDGEGSADVGGFSRVSDCGVIIVVF